MLADSSRYSAQTEKMLTEEKQSDDTLRAQFRDKWARSESLKLTESIRSNLETYKQMIASATTADSVSTTLSPVNVLLPWAVVSYQRI